MRAGRETESYGCKVCEVRWWGVGMPHPHVHAPSKHETCTASVTKHTAHSTHARRARAEGSNVRKRKVLGTLATSRTRSRRVRCGSVAGGERGERRRVSTVRVRVRDTRDTVAKQHTRLGASTNEEKTGGAEGVHT